MPHAAPLVFMEPKEMKKLAGLVLLMCGLAHARRKEMQKRWLKPGQEPRLIVDHPAFAYLLENASHFAVAYFILRFLPRPKQNRPLFTLMVGLATANLAVEPLLLFEKFVAEYVYQHVSYFSPNQSATDWGTVMWDRLTCNIPAGAVITLGTTAGIAFMPSDRFTTGVLEPKPLQLVPYLAKYAFCRVVVDVVFGIAHKAMHDYPAIYNAVHKRHHEHTTPRSYTNLHFSCLDLLLEAFMPVGVAIAALAALGHHPDYIEQFSLFVPMIYFESASHTGKEVPTVTWFPLLSPLVDMLTGCDQRLIEYHTRHHQLYRCNYSISPWVDRLWGTYKMDLPKSYNAVTATPPTQDASDALQKQEEMLRVVKST